MLDYEKKEKILLKTNILNLRKQIDTKKISNELELKILNFSIKFDLDFDYVIRRIKEDDLFLLHFVKMPSKQNFHEKEAIEYIGKIKNVSNAIKLNSGGNNAIYIQNGNIISGANNTALNSNKSIDFYWEYVNTDGVVFKCYATHKYTKQSGGAQDNQFNDVQNFVNSANGYSKNDGIIFFAICDGEFYKEFYPGQNNCTRLKYLENSTRRNSPVHVCDIDTLESILISL